MTGASKPAVESAGTNKPARKRRRVRGSQKSQASRKQRASEQGVAKDRARHYKKAAYASTTLKVQALKHSAPAYAGNMTRQGGVPLPRELGCGYRLLKYVPG